MATSADEHAAEWLSCAADAGYFIDQYGIIDHPQGDGLALLPFRLWPAQVVLVWKLMLLRLIIILKARQLGISWLVCAYILWLCFFQDGKVALLFSKGQLEANELARRISVLYHRLPDWMKAIGPALIKDNTGELIWENGSRVQSLPATQNAGRTFTASIVVLDEFAFVQWATELYTALKPTIDGGGQLVILSTANGTGNLFHDLWQKAIKKINRLTALFLDWRARPDRDDAWYAATAADAVQSSLMGQEYPATPDEAFAATNAARFLPSILWWDACKEALPPLGPREPLVLAADAGVSNDYFALVGTTRHPERHQDIAVRLVRVWKPKGKPLDFDDIEREINQIIDGYNVVQLTFDKYQLHQMMTRLGRHCWTDEFSQQGERLSADKGLLDLIQTKRIAWTESAETLELRQALDNADRQIDAAEHKLRMVKRTDSLHIDPAVACAMSVYRCLELNV